MSGATRDILVRVVHKVLCDTHVRGYAVLPAVDIRCHASGHPYLIIKANFTNPISAWLLRWLAASLRWQRSTSRPRRHPRRCICAWLL